MTTTQTPKAGARRRLAVKINADSRWIVYPVVALVAGLIVTNMIASYNGLLAVSVWAHYPDGLRWTTPVMLDGAIVVYSAALLIRRARGERTRLAWAGIIGGTALSAAANGAHVVLEGVPDAAWMLGVGAAVASLAPVAGALALHQLTDLAIASPDDELAPSRRTSRRATRIAAQQTAFTTCSTSPADPTPSAPSTVPPPARAPRGGSSAGRDREEQRAEFVGHLATGMSVRAAGAACGLAPSTAQRWANVAREDGFAVEEQGVLIPV